MNKGKDEREERNELLAKLQKTHGKAMYGNVMADFMFKRLFGNKIIMLPFLKMVLPDEGIVDIDYLPTEELGDTPQDNKVVFDISCTTADGRTLIIEMQKAYQTNFKNRSIAYVSSKITSQSRKQRENYCLRPDKPWRYNLSPVYIVAILNFSFTHDEDFPKDRYISSYHIREDETNELFNKTLNLTFIEMERFNKEESECGTVLDKLTYSLKHMHTLNAPPSFFNESFFRDLYNLAKLNNFEAEEIRNYMRSLFAASDYANTIDYARENGKAIGKEQGIAIGQERGIAIGEERGIAIGTARRNAELADAMLAKRMDIELICELTGLTSEEVNALKQ